MEIKIKQQRRRDRDRETGSGSEHENRKNPGLNSMVKMIPINDNNDGKVYVRAYESRREVGEREQDKTRQLCNGRLSRVGQNSTPRGRTRQDRIREREARVGRVKFLLDGAWLVGSVYRGCGWMCSW